MSATIIDGKTFAAACARASPKKPRASKPSMVWCPGLATVLVGNDPASEVYVRNKNKTAEELGFNSVSHHLPGTASEADVLAQVRALNDDQIRTRHTGADAAAEAGARSRPCSTRSIPPRTSTR